MKSSSKKLTEFIKLGGENDTNLIKLSGIEIGYEVFLEAINPNQDEKIKFNKNFFKGYNNRASVRVTKPSNIKADQMITGATFWDGLNQIITGKSSMSEIGFGEFAKELVKENPNSIFMDSSSGLLGF